MSQQTWIKPRHKVVISLLRPFLEPYVRWKYHITADPFPENADRPYLIVFNHQTGFDQFFPFLVFHQPLYFVASEDIFSMGWVSKLIRWLLAPIPIKKQTTDLQAVKNCIRVAREGGSIAIAPEGHRTFHGKTVYMKPAIGSLAKKLGLPLVIFRIEGGYGVQPRWSDVVRGGHMRCYVKRVLEPEEMKAMSGEEVAKLIEEELTVDEAKVTGSFPHKKNAEFLERVLYVCPWCGLSEFESNGDIIECKKCRRQIRHLDTKELQGVDFDFPHRFVSDWYEWQNDYVNQLDLTAMTDAPLYRDTVRISRVIPEKRKELLKKDAPLQLYGDRIRLDGEDLYFSDLGAVTLLGKNKLNIYRGKEILQLKGSKRFNALKYLNFYHRHKNITQGDQYGKFLGL